MRKVLLMCLITTIGIAQSKETTNFHIFTELGIDVKMAVQGPYKGKSNDTNGGTLNYEVKAGLEWDKVRIGFGYESHQAIKYQKASFFGDWNFRDKLLIFNADNFITRTGLEGSIIYRKDPPEDHRDMTKDWVQLGANFGIYYNIKHRGSDTGFEIGVNWNTFRGEEHYRNYQKTFFGKNRNDVMVVIVRNF